MPIKINEELNADLHAISQIIITSYWENVNDDKHEIKYGHDHVMSITFELLKMNYIDLDLVKLVEWTTICDIL